MILNVQGGRIEERSLLSGMEDMEDAMNVLRNHAESPHPSFHGMNTIPSHMANQTHSNGLIGYPPPLESHLVNKANSFLIDVGDSKIGVLSNLKSIFFFLIRVPKRV